MSKQAIAIAPVLSQGAIVRPNESFAMTDEQIESLIAAGQAIAAPDKRSAKFVSSIVLIISSHP